MFGFLQYVYIGIGALAAFALFSLWDGLVDDPAVRREALAGYVLKSEKTAIQAQLTEERRRAAAAAQSLEEHRKRLDAAVRAEALASDKLEAEIAENEKLLEADGRACRLDRADVDNILREPRQEAQ